LVKSAHSWQNVTLLTSWQNVSWKNISWQNVTWLNVSWQNVTWQNDAVQIAQSCHCVGPAAVCPKTFLCKLKVNLKLMQQPAL